MQAECLDHIMGQICTGSHDRVEKPAVDHIPNEQPKPRRDHRTSERQEICEICSPEHFFDNVSGSSYSAPAQYPGASHLSYKIAGRNARPNPDVSHLCRTFTRYGC